MPPSRLAVFDLDGTLVASEAVDADCFVEALGIACGFSAVDTDWGGYAHVTDRGILDALWRARRGRLPTATERRRFARVFGRLLRRTLATTPCPPLAGCRELLAGLAAGGRWAAAVATGGLGPTARLKLASAGLDVFDLPLASADDETSRAGIVGHAIGRAAVHHGVAAFSRIVLVGDAPWDLETAATLGLPFVGVGGRRRDLLAAGASHAFDDYLGGQELATALDTCRVPSAAGVGATAGVGSAP